MIQYRFVKTSGPALKESEDKVLQTLGPVTEMEISKFEHPLQSIRRVIGKEFWKLGPDSPDDIIDINIDEYGVFNMKIIESDSELSAKLISFLTEIFTQFVTANNGNRLFTTEAASRKLGKLSVTTSKGVVSVPFGLSDLNAVATYDANNYIIGVKHVEKMLELQNKLNEANASYNKIAAVDAEKAKTIASQMEEYSDTMKQYSIDVCREFLNTIASLTGVENFDDYIDVMVLLSIEFADETNPSKTIKQSTVLDYHYTGWGNETALKQTFRL